MHLIFEPSHSVYPKSQKNIQVSRQHNHFRCVGPHVLNGEVLHNFLLESTSQFWKHLSRNLLGVASAAPSYIAITCFSVLLVHMSKVDTPASSTSGPRLGRSQRVLQTLVTISEVHHMPHVCGCACVWRRVRRWTWHTPCVGMSCLAVGRKIR